MDVVFQLGEASVAEVRDHLPDPPSYSAVRTMIRYLEGKGFLRHRQQGTKYIYRASETKESVSRTALSHLIKTFFGGSASDAMAFILDANAQDLTDDDLDRIEQLIRETREEGR